MTVELRFGTVESMSDKMLVNAAVDTLIEIDVASSSTGGRSDQILAETYLVEARDRGIEGRVYQRARDAGVESIEVSTA